MPYAKMNYGFNACPVEFGPLKKQTSEAEMIKLADQANAGGFTFQSHLAFGEVLEGLYPAGCESSPNLSWPLYLKFASLPQFMEHQTQTNWCWAAGGASVGNYYWGPGTFTQCGIANSCQEKTTCCTDPTGCNEYGYMDKALKAAKSYESHGSGTAGFPVIQARIDRGQPVGTRVAWNGGGAHFTMVTGYNNNGNKITVQDPWYGTSTISFSAYPTSYHGGGTWTHTYYTQKQ